MPPKSSSTPQSLVRILSPAGTEKARFSVEEAKTPEAWSNGLMERQSLPLDHGMLFVFPDEIPRTFWMKDTLIPLDMAFANKEGIVVSLALAVQPCRSEPCELIHSGHPASYVLEVSAGALGAAGIALGDNLIVP